MGVRTTDRNYAGNPGFNPCGETPETRIQRNSTRFNGIQPLRGTSGNRIQWVSTPSGPRLRTEAPSGGRKEHGTVVLDETSPAPAAPAKHKRRTNGGLRPRSAVALRLPPTAPDQRPLVHFTTCERSQLERQVRNELGAWWPWISGPYCGHMDNRPDRSRVNQPRSGPVTHMTTGRRPLPHYCLPSA